MSELSKHSTSTEWFVNQAGLMLLWFALMFRWGFVPLCCRHPAPCQISLGSSLGGVARFPEKQGLAFVSGPTRGPRPGNADMFETKSIIGHQEHGDSGGAFHIGPVLYGVLCSSSGKDAEGRTMANYTKVDQFLPWIYGTIFTQSWP